MPWPCLLYIHTLTQIKRKRTAQTQTVTVPLDSRRTTVRGTKATGNHRQLNLPPSKTDKRGVIASLQRPDYELRVIHYDCAFPNLLLNNLFSIPCLRSSRHREDMLHYLLCKMLRVVASSRPFRKTAACSEGSSCPNV